MRDNKPDKKSRFTSFFFRNREDFVIDIFGSTIEYATILTQNSDGFPVPKIVRDCIMYLNRFGLDHMGIYRITGVISKIEALRKKYNSTSYFDIDLEREPVTAEEVSSLFKKYIRELSSPIISKDLSAVFSKLSDLYVDDNDKLLKNFRKTLLVMNSSNYFTLCWIVQHLKKLIKHSHVNRMNIANILIIFSPPLNIPHNVLKTFLMNTDALFPSIVYNIPDSIPFYKRKTMIPEKTILKYLVEELGEKHKALDFLNRTLKNCTELHFVSSLNSFIANTEERITTLKYYEFSAKENHRIMVEENMTEKNKLSEIKIDECYSLFGDDPEAIKKIDSTMNENKEMFGCQFFVTDNMIINSMKEERFIKKANRKDEKGKSKHNVDSF